MLGQGLLQIRGISSLRVPCNACGASSNFITSRLVESETEWRFVLPHLSRHIVPPSQLIGETVSVCDKDKTTNSLERFRCEELDFGIGVICLHQACWVHLDPLEIDGSCSPVQCSPFVVGRCNKSGRYWASNELLVKSAPKPPLANITGPHSFKSAPPFS